MATMVSSFLLKLFSYPSTNHVCFQATTTVEQHPKETIHIGQPQRETTKGCESGNWWPKRLATNTRATRQQQHSSMENAHRIRVHGRKGRGRGGGDPQHLQANPPQITPTSNRRVRTEGRRKRTSLSPAPPPSYSL